MADLGQWWKLWCSVFGDPDMDNLDIADFGRFCKFGAYVKLHGTSGSIRIAPPAKTLCASLQVPDFPSLLAVFRRVPGVRVDASGDDVAAGTCVTVSFTNWQKYQGDLSTPRVRAYREKKRLEEKRGEERRREEKNPPPGTPLVWDGVREDQRAYLELLEPPFTQWRDPPWWRSLVDAFPKLDLLDEAKRYVAWWRSAPTGRKHKELRRAFREWCATSDRWRDRDERRAAARGGSPRSGGPFGLDLR